MRPDRLPEPVRTSGRLELADLDEPVIPLKHPEAQEFYREQGAILIETGVLQRIDLPMLALWAQAYADCVVSVRILAVQGHGAAGSKGQMVPHPSLKILRDSTATYERLAQNLCGSPVARARLGLAVTTTNRMAQDLERDIGPWDPTAVDATCVDMEDLADVELPGVAAAAV